MNALVTFRSNAVGNLVANGTQRQQAQASVSANLRAKIEGIIRAQTKAQGVQSSSAKAAAAQNSATKANGEDEEATAAVAEDALGRDAFLQLLVQQLTNQDPLEPMDNTQMVTQLAQFSALEQQQSLNSSFDTLAERVEFLNGNVDQLNFISAQGMLGKYIEGFNLDQEFVGGIVDSVHLEGSIVVLSIGDEVVPMTGVIGVADEEPSEPINDPETTQAPDPEENPQSSAEENGDGAAKVYGS